MTDVSKQVSLREIVGTIAPGAMVLVSVIYAAGKIPGLGGFGYLSDTSITALLIVTVLAYGIGTLLKSATEFAFERVTQLTTMAQTASGESQLGTVPTGWAARIARILEPRVKRLALYLGGGKNIAASNKAFRESWHVRAVEEGIISEHLFSTATAQFRELFGVQPEGEESLVLCEFYIRQMTPGAMQEIEENAARAALMGNLFIPMLFALFAVAIGFLFDLFAFLGGLPASFLNLRLLVGIAAQALTFVLVVAAFPYVVNMIGQQWTETSRMRVKLVLVAFTIACRLKQSGSQATQVAV
jgi:hypothetical protein